MKKFLLLAGVACLFTTAAEASVSQYVAAKLSYDFNKVKVKTAVNGNPVALNKLSKDLISPHVLMVLEPVMFVAKLKLTSLIRLNTALMKYLSI
ncbi:hypothetical protein IJ556_07215 [bacterium]|nr:hypothetical protein [bacterium]